jgi:hypothetical protein
LPSQTIVYAGSAEIGQGQRRIALEIRNHERYNNSLFTLGYDIALIYLREPYVLSDNIKPIELPLYNHKVPENISVSF